MAEAYILTKDEGGRHTPFFTNYRPQFYFRTTDVTGIVKLPAGTEMVMPGDNVSVRSRADRSDRHGREASFRHPRRRPYRRCRRGGENHEVNLLPKMGLKTNRTKKATDCNWNLQGEGRVAEWPEPLHRSVAQLVEHRSPKPRAVGSSPSTPARFLKMPSEPRV